MSRRASVQHRLEFALIRLARGLDRLLGARRSERLAAALGRVVYRRLRIRADVVERQLRQAFPDRDDAWIRRTAAASYAHLGREGMSMLRLSRQGAEDVIAATDVEGLDGLRGAVEAGTGAVLVTGHFGNWEIGGAALAARGIPLDVVAQRQANPLFDRLINDARERLGMTVIRRGNATKESLRTLRAGRVIALVADQDARGSGLFVPFMNRPASTHRGPALLALRSGAPVFMGLATRRPDGRYRVVLREIPVPGLQDVPDARDPDARILAHTAAHVAALESAVRADPAQYLWQHRRWKTAPPEPEARAEPPAAPTGGQGGEHGGERGGDRGGLGGEAGDERGNGQ